MIYELTYVTTDPLRWGAGTGSPHSPETADDVIATLEERVWTLENTPPVANSVVNMTQSGNVVTFWLTDGTTSFSATLPGTSIQFIEGGWPAETGVFANNLFTYQRAGIYEVLRDHVTAAEFDPNASNESGSLYKLLLDPFSGSAPKQIPETTDLQYVPVLLDANLYLIWPGDVMVTLLVPTDDDVAFAIGTELHLRQDGAGAIAVEGDTGVTVKPGRPGFATVTPWEGANASIKKVEANVWHYMGPGTEST